MAAKAAAESGLSVLLLEKRQEIGEPLRCAEGVSFRSELSELIRVQPDWISREVHGVRMHSPNNDSFCIDVDCNGGGGCGGYILERKCFDRGLALQAARSGARVLVKTRATGMVRKDGLWRVAASCGGKSLQMVAGGIPTSGPMSSTTSDGIMLVGDAARQSDPLTGGGIINAMRAGIFAGETAGKAVHSGDTGRAALKEYEDRCRIAIDKQLKRRYQAKKIFLKLDDDDLNNLIGSLHGKDLTAMNTRGLISVLFKQNPRMLWRLGVSNLIERL